jgi:pimeloyl-ACP methyl ester carboxylesterase
VPGGRVYVTRVDGGGAAVALWRYAAPAEAAGAMPLLVLPELGTDRGFLDDLAASLQRRGRDVFLLEWRGCGRSGQPGAATGGLEALLLGDAPAAFDAVLRATGADRIALLGQGLGGTAAVLLAASERGGRVAGLALASVPAVWEVPNEVVRRLLGAVDRSPASAGLVPLAGWADSKQEVDLFELLLAHGTALFPARKAALRASMGNVAPALLRDLRRWMEAGDLVLPDGPLARGGSLRAAFGRLQQPLLVIAAPRDNLVHLEHALAVRRIAAQAPRQELLLQRIEGYPEDAGHLALSAPWAASALGPPLHEFLEGLR